MRIRFNIPAERDRINLITALANSGYPVSVEEDKHNHLGYNYYVVVEIPEGSTTPLPEDAVVQYFKEKGLI